MLLQRSIHIFPRLSIPIRFINTQFRMSSSSSPLTPSPELSVALSAVLRASVVTTSIFQTIPASITKEDKSPVTLGDFAAQAVVNTLLSKYFPNDGIVGEEESDALRADEGLKEKVGQLVKTALEKDEKDVSAGSQGDLPGGKPKWGEADWQDEAYLAAIDKGNYEGGANGREY